MDRYHRVEKPREETPIKENEIRIMTQGRMRNYITYAINLIQEKGANEIVFKAMGRAINKTVMIVELIKRRVAGLHQITEVGSIDITDTWEPLEEGLLPLETTRHVSMITITLSKVELDKSNVGYQVPLPEDQVRPMVDFEYDEEGGPSAGRGRGRGGRRGRRGGRGMNSGMNGGMNGGVNGEVNGGTNGGMVEHNNEGGNDNRGQRGGGYTNGYVPRGRGGFRGRGRRGGYGGPRSDNQEGDGYFDDAPMPPQGRGRGRGRGPRGRGMGRRGRGGIDAPLGANGLNEAVTAE